MIPWAEIGARHPLEGSVMNQRLLHHLTMSPLN